MLKKLIENCLPYGMEQFLENNYIVIHNFKSNFLETISNLRVIQENTKYKNIHKGQRCFVLCTGPSINRQRIELLKNEFVFGVSTGYLHEKYKIIKPQYHCQPQLTYSKLFNENFAIEHFKRMAKETSLDTEFFFNITERRLIETSGVLVGRKVNYVYFNGKMKVNDKAVYSIEKTIPTVSSVPIMGLILAIYMGFSEIYLLGTEYNHIFNRKHEHAMQDEFMKQLEKHDLSTNSKNEIVANNQKIFERHAQLLLEFQILHQIGKENNIKIYNATDGGILDEFPRVDFNELMKVK